MHGSNCPQAPLYEALVGPLVGVRLYELSSLPRPANTSRVKAALLPDAARIFCLVLMAQSFIARVLWPNSVTKGVTKAFRLLP